MTLILATLLCCQATECAPESAALPWESTMAEVTPDRAAIVLISGAVRKIGVFSIADRKVVREAALEAVPRDLGCDAQGRAWVLFDEKAVEFRIEDLSIQRSVKMPRGAKHLSVSPTGQELYFTREGWAARVRPGSADVEWLGFGEGKLEFSSDGRTLHTFSGAVDSESFMLLSDSSIPPSKGFRGGRYDPLSDSASFSAYFPCGGGLVQGSLVIDRHTLRQRTALGRGRALMEPHSPFFAFWDGRDRVAFHRRDTFAKYLELRLLPSQGGRGLEKSDAFLAARGMLVLVPRGGREVILYVPDQEKLRLADSHTVVEAPPAVLHPGERLDWELRLLETQDFTIELLSAPPGAVTIGRRLVWAPGSQEFYEATPVREFRVRISSARGTTETFFTVSVAPRAVRLYEFEPRRNDRRGAISVVRWSPDRRYLFFGDEAGSRLLIYDTQKFRLRAVKLHAPPRMVACVQKCVYVTFERTAGPEIQVIDLEEACVLAKVKPPGGTAIGVSWGEGRSHVYVLCRMDTCNFQVALVPAGKTAFSGWLKQAKKDAPVQLSENDMSVGASFFEVSPDGSLLGLGRNWILLSKDGTRAVEDARKRQTPLMNGYNLSWFQVFHDKARSRVYFPAVCFGSDFVEVQNQFPETLWPGPPSYDVCSTLLGPNADKDKKAGILRFLSADEYTHVLSLAFPQVQGAYAYGVYCTDSTAWVLIDGTLHGYPLTGMLPEARRKSGAVATGTPAERKEASAEIQKGEKALAAGDPATALKAFQKAREILPRGTAGLHLARALEKSGDIAAAERTYREVLVVGLEAAADSILAYRDYAAFLIRQKRPWDAERVLIDLIRIHPKAREGFLDLADLHESQKAYEAAWTVLQGGLRRFPDDSKFKERAAAMEKRISETATTACPKCEGTGGKCDLCGGKGSVIRVPCGECLGSGTNVIHEEWLVYGRPTTVMRVVPCPACAGRGARFRKK